VTEGVYAYIRHPIYAGLILITVAAELIAKSNLFVVALLLFIPAYVQARNEEKILASHFGNEFIEYKKRTQYFIPFIF